MKNLYLVLLFFPVLSFGQIYSDAQHLEANRVSGQWFAGTVILNNGETLNGEVRGYMYKGNDVKSFRYRTEKGSEVTTYNADNCVQIVYNGLNIISLPKNLKKPEGKKRFYIALYHGEHFSVLQDPKTSIASGGGNAGLVTNQGEMLSFLAYKDKQLVKVNKLNFKKQMKRLLSENKEWLKKAGDKKWFKYSNVYGIADHYNDTFKQ